MKNLVILLILGLTGFVVLRDSSPTAVIESDRITTISTGEAITIEDHLSDGWTVVEFGAEW